jgi:hypothetical protein
MQNFTNNKIHLLSFFTNGKNIDLGIDLTSCRNEFQSNAAKYFSSIIITCPSELIKKDQKWLEVFEDRNSWVQNKIQTTGVKFAYNKNWAALNFLLWKPLLIQDVIQNNSKIKSGDIVLYHDINIERYPEYLHGMHKWKKIINQKMKNKSILLFCDNDMTINQDTKKELIDKYLANFKQPENLHHIWAGALAVRKDEMGISYIKSWNEICSNISNISPVTLHPDAPGFIWHSQEQACLSVLYHSTISDLKNYVRCVYLYGQRSINVKLSYKIIWLIKQCKYRITKLFKLSS